ncbi:MAG: glycosyltransferase family 4 protein [Deltaproteobacteria bacterium]|nr:glycosyltransferase family 4 protein [Deltaproteobacteria bacterium]
MHILYIHQYFVPPDGKGGTRSYEMARRLVRAGHQVTLLTSSAFFPKHYNLDGEVSRLECDGIQLVVVRIPYSNKLSFRRRLLVFVEFAYRASVLAAGVEGIDLVFATSTPLTIAIPGIVAKSRRRVPMVFEVRDLWPEIPISLGAIRNPLLIWASKALERCAYRSSARVVALSPGMRDGVARAGYPAERVTVIPNSSDVQNFDVPDTAGQQFLSEHPYLKRGPLVTYTGTLGVVNNARYFVDIAERMLLLDPDVTFLIVGDGHEHANVRLAAQAAGVFEKNLWMLPPLPKNEIPKVLSATTLGSSFFIDNPVLWHNAANKFFDSLAAGRPIVLNYEGWQAELVRQRKAGVVVPPNDPVTAARLIQEFVRDEHRLRQGRQAARELAMNEFNRDILAEKLRRVLEEAARERRA